MRQNVALFIHKRYIEHRDEYVCRDVPWPVSSGIDASDTATSTLEAWDGVAVYTLRLWK